MQGTDTRARVAEAGKTCKKHLVHIHMNVVTASNKITVQIPKRSFLAWPNLESEQEERSSQFYDNITSSSNRNL
ncbi:hypothetical protein NC651_024153 [Populus alba x Populus x berolinensis]|nr:hypothetical protein NC651_024153 [Populus alba x Populus x berolinensis]